MTAENKIYEKSDSLIEILTEQCSDLEKLLFLSREEANVAQQNDFERLLEIVTERSEIGKRLEVFQQRIAELRSFLGTNVAEKEKETMKRIEEISSLIIIQDRQTKQLIASEKEKTSLKLRSLNQALKGTNSYLSSGEKGLRYSKKF